MKISLLATDLSRNNMIRAHVLATALKAIHEVEIIGPASSGKVWEPIAAEPFQYRILDCSPQSEVRLLVDKAIPEVSGDVLYALKPLAASLGVGLCLKKELGLPLVLDAEDWELGFILSQFRWRIVAPFSPNYRKCRYWENRIVEADAITVSNRFLQNRYGGELVFHGRDPNQFDPARFDRLALREKYRLDPDLFYILFMGTVRKFKGIESLIEAMAHVHSRKACLLFVGPSDCSFVESQCARHSSIPRDRIIVLGPKPFRDAPEILALCDLAVIPQRRGPATVGQVPCKIYEAMAMAKPIISTHVGDIPEILEGCGSVLSKDCPVEIAKAIDEILGKPEKAKEMGRAAREKQIRYYSIETMTKTLQQVFEKVRR